MQEKYLALIEATEWNELDGAAVSKWLRRNRSKWVSVVPNLERVALQLRDMDGGDEGGEFDSILIRVPRRHIEAVKAAMQDELYADEVDEWDGGADNRPYAQFGTDVVLRVWWD